jgi:type IV secretion system protein VirB9
MSRRILAHLASLSLLAACAWLPARAQVIDHYDYVPDQIYQVRTGLGITTQIELAADDEILDYSTGFSSGWDLDRRGNVFYLKPRNIDVDTNMLVRSAGRSYIFELKVVATDWRALEQAKREGVQYKVVFRYPPGEGAAAAVDAMSANPTTAGERAESGPVLHFDYDIATRTRNGWLIPTNVHDDGRFTYIRMGEAGQFPSGSFPAVFARESEDGEDFVVNTRVEGDVLVVHGTYPYLVVRHGQDVVGIRRNPR